MSQHIGIVACSAEGAALCYRSICLGGADLLGPHEHPEISMHTYSLGEYMKCIYRGDWQGVGELMLSSANKLASLGADFLICPDNTIHQGLPFIEERLPLRWLHIADAVAAQAVGRRFRRLGLTGTRYLVESEDVPGLVAEADSPNVLVQKLRTLIPELLELNGVLTDRTASFHILYQHEDSGVLTF